MPTVSIKANASNEQDLQMEVTYGSILFDELDRQGKQLPHGCLAGSCGACRIIVLEGAENLAVPGGVEKDTIDSIKNNYCSSGRSELVANKNIRLSCRAKVQGDITIAVLK